MSTSVQPSYIGKFSECLILLTFASHCVVASYKQAGRTRHRRTFSALHRLSIHLKVPSEDFWLSSPRTQQFFLQVMDQLSAGFSTATGEILPQSAILFFINCLPMFVVPNAEPKLLFRSSCIAIVTFTWEIVMRVASFGF